MATVASSTRAATRGASRMMSAKKGNLAIQMHKQLYPHLYENSGPDAAPDAAQRLTEKNVSKVIEMTRSTKKGQEKGHWTQQQKGRFSVAPSRTQLHRSGISVQPSKPSIQKTCPDPVSTITSSQIALLDPTGARTRLFAKTNPECARVGDILLVRLRTGDPFAGVCINIRRRGVDTAILLRGQLTRVGVEMWYKVYSPLVEGIEVVQRAAKRARRARLTYMRTVKHDRGSVENVVRVYLRQKAALGSSGEGGKKGAAAGAAKGIGGGAGGKKAKGRGKKR